VRYLPHTREDLSSMLKAVGVEHLEDLFSTVPEACRRSENMRLPPPLTEWELSAHLARLAGTTATAPGSRVFVGAGSYDHFIPQVVSHLLSRSEFVTSYTPYQPEMSQGTLQGIFEYQTLTCRLLGLEVANASLYDGASALAEALLMAVRITGQKRIVLSRLIHPHYRRVVKTYFGPTGYDVLELPCLANGRTDLSPLTDVQPFAAVAIQSPNFFGCVEDLRAAAQAAHSRKALLVGSFTEALAYGLLASPGSRGADIACGEGQSLGIPQSYGGPGLGMFAARMEHVRSMPGRLVGETRDADGRRGYVLTLATREQHIRREKATSNICTNNSLCALNAAMFMAGLGGAGLRDLARLNYDKSEYLKSALRKSGFSIPFEAPTFNEFVARGPAGFDARHAELLQKGIVAGLPLFPYYPELADHYLFCVTETKTREDLDALVREVEP
jgi:glycine dehydrogenase subunit 1